MSPLHEEQSHSGFATMVVAKKRKRNLVSKVTRRRLILHMLLAAGMFPLLGFNSAERGVRKHNGPTLICVSEQNARDLVHARWSVTAA